MNIQFQICGLSILLLLMIFYKSHKTLQLYKEKVFYGVLCIITVSLTGDVLSLAAIQYRHVIPLLLVEMICKSYVISLIWGAWSALVYVFTDLVSEKKHKKITKKLALLTAAQSLLIYFLPISIFDNGIRVYTYGPAVMGVYIFVASYIVVTITVTCVFRKKLNPRIRFAIMLWMLIWMASAMIQFFNSGLLIVGFASAIGVLILFVIMENPERNLERRLGCFNSYALTEYLNQLFERNKNFGVLEISFENTGASEEQWMNETYDVIREILRYMDRYHDILVFKNINLSLVLISEKKESLEKAGNAILQNLVKHDLFCKETQFILTDQTDAFSDMDELFRFLSFVHMKCSEERGTLIHADKDMVVVFREKYLIEREIAEALSENRVEVFFQPIYSNEEKAFTSAEALARIRKKDGVFLPPGIFIPVAEENGQILELGERVFEKVCDFLKNTEAVRLGIHYVEVNLSVLQCETADLSERLISIIEKYQINPGLINLEITETGSISARRTLLENMKKLIEYGFSFSLDDFGKGESNLMYVVEMPISIVKLDYDMSKAFFSLSKARNVVRAVVSMAHGMKLKVVAEGIETKEESEDMYKEEIDYIQGFYYSRPLPGNEFLRFLQRNAVM